MSSEHFDVIVVGVGTMGSATCMTLAARGVRVLGLEQFDVPHGRGAHHGFSRAIRLSYFEHSDYVPLLRRAWDLWHQLEADTGCKCLYGDGMLYMGPPERTLINKTREAAEKYHLPYDMLTHSELAKQYPQFVLPDHHVGMFDHMAGFVVPEMGVGAMAHHAMMRGAVLRAHEPVVNWRSDGSGVVVTTPKGEYAANRVVFTGGAWSGKLLADLGIAITVTRQSLGWVWPRKPDLFAYGTLPTWAIDDGGDGIYYGFPMRLDNPGFKTAHHLPADPVDPDHVSREPTPADEADFRKGIDLFMPEADGPTLAIRICLYANSPDLHFVMDTLPGDERVVIGCGFSGHGFKFAPAIGESLADLAMHGKSELPIEFLSLKRFG